MALAPPTNQFFLSPLHPSVHIYASVFLCRKRERTTAAAILSTLNTPCTLLRYSALTLTESYLRTDPHDTRLNFIYHRSFCVHI
jgi:hypothetical protein